MTRRSTILLLLLTLVFAGTAASAKPPITFSFASDDYHEGPTFSGDTATIRGYARVDLLLDQQGDLEGGITKWESWFTFEGDLSKYQIVAVGANFLHIWQVKGHFEFVHYDVGFGFPLLLRYDFENAVLTSLSPVVGQAGKSMTLQDNWPSDAGLVATDGNGVAAVLGLVYPPGYVNIGIDWAFTLTHVRSGGIVGSPPLIDPGGKFLEDWQSEGSFSSAGGN
jgi:hypothetical protein